MSPELDSLPKRDLILQAGTAMFLEHGYGATSMDAIAKRAGVSKQTIYNHFSSKEVLFAAIIDSQCRCKIRPVLMGEFVDQPVDVVLITLAARILDTIMAEETLALFRLVLAELVRFPELGRVFYSSGPAANLQALTDYLALQHSRGIITAEYPATAADHFISLVRGEFYLRALLGVVVPPDQATLDQFITTAVATFLRAYAPR